MKDFMNKMLNVIGLDYEEEDNGIESREARRKKDEVPRAKNNNVTVVPQQSTGRKGKVVDINTTTQFQVMVMLVEKFEDTMYIADHLKLRKPVVVNVENVLDETEVQRVIDFIGGVVYALEGEMQKISKGIILVTPYNVKIMGDIKNELLTSGSFPWLK